MNFGTLYLIPTPIDEISKLNEEASKLLLNAIDTDYENSMFLIEEPKAGRRRWLRFGLPREVIEDFIYYNEHSEQEIAEEVVRKIKMGKNAYIMSDGGLPTFCDPGRLIVDLCHNSEIRVTSTPFCNSALLALALSGFYSDKFVFEGFLPREKDERLSNLKNIIKQKYTTILMDTPYRMIRLLRDLKLVLRESKIQRRIALCMNLGGDDEKILRGNINELLHLIADNTKAEFIIVLDRIPCAGCQVPCADCRL